MKLRTHINLCLLPLFCLFAVLIAFAGYTTMDVNQSIHSRFEEKDPSSQAQWFAERGEVFKRAERKSRQSILILGLGSVLWLILALFVARHLRTLVVRPVESLTARLKKVAEGETGISRENQKTAELLHLEDSLQYLNKRLTAYRQLTDKKLLETAEAFREVMEQSPHPIIFLDEAGQTFYRNPKANELMKGREGETLPKRLKDFAESVRLEEEPVIVEDAEEALPLKLGTETRYFAVTYFPLPLVSFDGSQSTRNGTTGSAFMLQDVTLARLSSDVKNNLIQTVSHELKTPITSARLALYLLAEEALGNLNEQQKELVESSKMDLDRLLSTIQNLLDLSRIRSRQEPARKQAVSLNSIVRQSIFAHEQMAKTRDIKMELEEEDQELEMLADEKHILVVMNNLLTNAIEHSSPSEKIRITVRKHEGRVRVDVNDNGPGVPDTLQKRIFDKFTPPSEVAGAGVNVGLQIARQIVEDHDGSIGCSSVEGDGSNFHFEIPALRGSPSAGM